MLSFYALTEKNHTINPPLHMPRYQETTANLFLPQSEPHYLKKINSYSLNTHCIQINWYQPLLGRQMQLTVQHFQQSLV